MSDDWVRERAKALRAARGGDHGHVPTCDCHRCGYSDDAFAAFGQEAIDRTRTEVDKWRQIAEAAEITNRGLWQDIENLRASGRQRTPTEDKWAKQAVDAAIQEERALAAEALRTAHAVQEKAVAPAFSRGRVFVVERLREPTDTMTRWFADHRHEFPDTFTGMCQCLAATLDEKEG